MTINGIPKQQNIMKRAYDSDRGQLAKQIYCSGVNEYSHQPINGGIETPIVVATETESK